MRTEEVNWCQIQEWYPKFKSVSIRTIIHELPESFVEYLLDDVGPFILPISVSNEDALPNRIHNPIDEEDYQVSEGEIALLLRSSDSLVHDLCHAYDSCSNKTMSRPPSFFLALRKWYSSLLPEMEFRCFVWGHHLVGISQREVTTFYPVLLEKKSDLQLLIENFFMDNVRLNFESENYTFDIYVTRDERVKIVDFNPWGAFTLPLLFTWEEFGQNAREGNSVDFRIVESQCGIRPGLKTAVPQDYLDTSPGSGWDQFLKKVDAEFKQQGTSPTGGSDA
ncbi:hypothetical protein GH714_007990 [Hevea brasiliensis]|uniref:Cell division cycle protein 123 homolog n=1 Tax=Hevea brasiliensis TaxID=3981 RepID=A0A6A6L3C6_HEVBR|nr:hypothetical protein GH714_007990 [Hevea brasiliensis]